MVIPPTVVDEVAKEIANSNNPTSQEEVAADVMESNPELLVNPLSASLKYLGIQETDPKQHSTIASFYESAISDTALLGSSDKDLATKVAWCAAFTNYILNDIGIETKDLTDHNDQTTYARVRAQNFVNLGTPVYNSSKKTKEDLQNAHRGDLVVKKGAEGYHVGFFAGINPNNNKEVLILGGNQNNEVNVTAYPLSEIVTINSLENIAEADTDLMAKINEDIKGAGSTI